MSEIRISTLREESWLASCVCDTVDARTAREVFSRAARRIGFQGGCFHGWWGDIIWNCQGNTATAEGEGAEEALAAGAAEVEEWAAVSLKLQEEVSDE